MAAGSPQQSLDPPEIKPAGDVPSNDMRIKERDEDEPDGQRPEEEWWHIDERERAQEAMKASSKKTQADQQSSNPNPFRRLEHLIHLIKQTTSPKAPVLNSTRRPPNPPLHQWQPMHPNGTRLRYAITASKKDIPPTTATISAKGVGRGDIQLICAEVGAIMLRRRTG